MMSVQGARRQHAVATIGRMLVDPVEAFRAVRDMRTRQFLVPLGITMGASLALLMLYYQTVNIDWLRAFMQPNATASQQEALHNLLTRNSLFIIGGISLMVTLPALYALFAFYFFLVAKILDFPYGFGAWFAFVVWASVPGILLVPIGFFVVLTAASGQIAPDQLNPANLNALVFDLPPTSGWASLLNSITLTSLWTAVLMAIGLRVWTAMSWPKSAGLVVIPYAIVYGAWAAIIVAAQQL